MAGRAGSGSGAESDSGRSLAPYRAFVANLVDAIAHEDVASLTFRRDDGGLSVYAGRGARVAWAEVDHDAATGDSPAEAQMYADLLVRELSAGDVPAVPPRRTKTVTLSGGPFSGQTREVAADAHVLYIQVEEIDLHADPPALRMGAHHYAGGGDVFSHHGLLWSDRDRGNVRRRRRRDA